MADSLSTIEQVEARNWTEKEMVRTGEPIDYNKQILHAAVQGVIDLLEAPSTQTAVNNAINSATQPLGKTLSANQKALIFARAAMIVVSRRLGRKIN